MRLPALVVLVALTGVLGGAEALAADWSSRSGWHVLGPTGGGTLLVAALGVGQAPVGAPAVTVAASIAVYAACFLPGWLGVLHAAALTAALVTPALLVPGGAAGLAALLVAGPLLVATGVIVTVARRGLDERARHARAIATEHQALHRVAQAAVAGEDVVAVAARELAHVLAVGVDAHEPDAGGVIERLGFRTLAAAPITLDRRAWGAVVVSTREDGTLPPAALARLAELADLLALSIVDADRRRTLVRDAATDPLTGLLNRRAFDERLGDEVARARRERRELALVLVDLDHFKAINDCAGHLAGDRVLQQVAAVLAAVVREGDVAARLGGDEFALLLRDAGADAGAAAAGRVRSALAVGDPAVTVSAGVCSLGDVPDRRALTAAADAALYATKHAGRDGCTTWPVR